MMSIARHSADERLFVRKKRAPYFVRFARMHIFKMSCSDIMSDVSRLVHFLTFPHPIPFFVSSAELLKRFKNLFCI